MTASSQLAQVRSEVEKALWKGLLEAWFPAALDRERGGYWQHMGRDWTPTPEQERFVVYESRLVWTSSQAVLLGRDDFKPYARHGVESLWKVFWDQESGGFYWWADLKGSPLGLSAKQKHTYGLAFALYGTAAAARALGEPQDRERLETAFRWFDQALHDGQEGGWHEVCGKDNRPILEPPGGLKRDVFGLPYNSKAQNSQLHVMEALTEVYRAWPDPLVRERLVEMVDVISRKMKSEAGHLHLLCTRDWQPLSEEPSHGHDIEAAFLLRDALDALGVRDQGVEDMARELAKHALEKAWDAEHGGLMEGTQRRKNPGKIWWVQAESLGAIAYFAAESPEGEAFFTPYLVRQWEFIRDHFLDPEHGGLYCNTSMDGKSVSSRHKGDPWSGLYHEARAFMTVLNRPPR